MAKSKRKHSRRLQTKKRKGKKPASKKSKARKVAKRKPAKKKTSRKRVTKAAPKKLVKYVERVSTERVMSGKRKRRRKTPRKHTATRRRRIGSNGGGSGMGLLVGAALGIGALYLFTKSSQPAPTNTYPALQQTSNYTRNSQASEIVSYAIAAGYAVDAIATLIDALNTSSDNDVKQYYDDTNLTGQVPGDLFIA